MKLLHGVDINGAQDYLTVRVDECDTEEIDLGIRGGLIRLQSQEGQWLGGAQIALAPHGRGAGWGQIGAAHNRLDFLDMLAAVADGEPDAELGEALASAFPSMIGESELAVFAVPDAPTYGEAFRDRYLRLLRQVDGLRPLLLWRPVAAALGWIAERPAGARAGLNVAVASLMPDGLHVSAISLEEELHRDEMLLVPQRNRSGRVIGGSFRGERLIEAARELLVSRTGLSHAEISASAMAPWRAAIGVAPLKLELVRLASNRGWLQLPPFDPPVLQVDPAEIPDEVVEHLASADVLLIEGPFCTNKRWREAVLQACAERGSVPELQAFETSQIASRGCLEAATRYRRGQPIYFDYLPQLQINAMVGGEPRFVDLIAAGHRCRGGETFRAEAPGSYAVGKGATRLTFWLFKEDFENGRRAEVDLPAEADRQYPLAVSVEQVPGQGFAKVRISSPEFEALRHAAITLDWMRMEEIPQSQDEVLTQLVAETGLAWPDTAVKPGHPFSWSPAHPSGNLIDLLAAYRAAPLFDGKRVNRDAWDMLKTLRTRFSRPDTPSFLAPTVGMTIDEQGAYRPLNSDGQLPDPASGLTVPHEAADELDSALAKLDEDLASLQRRFGDEIDAELLRDIISFGSWCFWRCPPRISELLIRSYLGELNYKLHHILLREGAARVVCRPEQLHRYFTAVSRRLQTAGKIAASEYAGLARVLGTSEEAAELIDHSLANRILQVTIEELAAVNSQRINDAYKRRFKAAVLMLAALLRHRKAFPAFLDPDEGQAARQLLAKLDEAEIRNLDFADRKQIQAERAQGQDRTRLLAAARRFTGNAEIIGELKAFLYQQGRDPNIIRRIDALEE